LYPREGPERFAERTVDDGFADVFTDCLDCGCWNISFYGFENWAVFAQSVPLNVDFAAVGRFLGQSAADVPNLEFLGPLRSQPRTKRPTLHFTTRL
jgi:hypothetical protein